MFRTDVKKCMKDCILSLMWAKKDVYGFFKDHCPSKELEVIKKYEEENLSRGQMIDAVFDNLSARTDNGLGQFRAMLKTLCEWSHFDKYYFDQIKKLDRPTAIANIKKLRLLSDQRDGQIKDQRKDQDLKEQERKKSRETRENLKQRFIGLYSSKIKPQERGYELEKILQELSKLEGFQTTEAFKCIGEQIDGAVKYDGEHYLIEAKWQNADVSTEPLYAFAQKVEGKMYGRGIFVSINGFSPAVVEALVTGKAIKTILVDGEDLILVLEERMSLTKMIDEKVKAAQTKGQIYIHPVTSEKKIKAA